jgi:tetratricopeptide (TPR) repeat protein
MRRTVSRHPSRNEPEAAMSRSIKPMLVLILAGLIAAIVIGLGLWYAVGRAPTYASIGDICDMRDDYAGAERWYRKASAIKPDNAEYRANLGEALIELKRFDEGVQKCEEAIRLDPSRHEPYYQIGCARMDQEDSVGALEMFREARRVAQTQSDIDQWKPAHLDHMVKLMEDAVKIEAFPKGQERLFGALKEALEGEPTELEELQGEIDALKDAEAGMGPVWFLMGERFEGLSRTGESIECYSFGAQLGDPECVRRLTELGEPVPERLGGEA